MFSTVKKNSKVWSYYRIQNYSTELYRKSKTLSISLRK